MNLTHLTYINEIHKCGSISQAAKKLYINQPNLSKILKDMEEELHIKIFERTNKGVIPTKQGMVFLRQIELIVEQVNNLENFYHQPHEIIKLNISIPRSSYIAIAFSDYLSENISYNSFLNINYHETNSFDTIKNVFEGESNLGIIRFHVDEEKYYHNILSLKGLSYQNIFQFHFCLLMSEKNVLANQIIKTNDLDEQIQIVHGDITQFSVPIKINDNVKNSKIIHIYERGSQFEILDKVDNSYMWVSPMPQEILKRFHLVQKECEDLKIACKDVLIYRKKYSFTKEEENFIHVLKDTISLL